MTTILCRNCGRVVERTGSAQKYCPDCARNVKRLQNRRYMRLAGLRAAIMPYLPPPPPKPRKSPLAGKSLSEVTQMAREAGMSYGMFVARDGQK